MNKLFNLGETINRNGIKGKIAAVGWLGERYYWIEQPGGTIAMVPAVCLEEEIDNQEGDDKNV